MPAADYPDWTRIPREAFVRRHFHYTAGEHLTILGPTQCGKTTLLQQLAAETARPRLPAATMVMKPRDKTVRAFLAEHEDFKVVTNWPPPRVPPWGEKPRGYVLWPVQKPSADSRADLNRIYWPFKKLLDRTYQFGNQIVFADELFGLVNELKLTTEIQALYTRGAAMGAAVWAGIQRPAEVPRNAYSMAQHVFIYTDPDEETRKRYGQISGLSIRETMHNLDRLELYEFLYIHRATKTRCIVGA